MAMKKKFIEVESPVTNETLEVLGTAEDLNHKTIKLDLARKMRGKGIEVVLELFNEDGKLIAYPKRVELVKSSIRRMMRKRINYVEDSFDISCADIKARIKPFLLTRKKVSRAVRNNLRRTTKEFLIEYIKTRNFIELTAELLAGILQKEMLPKLKKVYPLSLCEIRIFETKELEKANKEFKQEIEARLPRDDKEENKNKEEVIDQMAEIETKEKEVVLDQAAEIEAEVKKKKVVKKTKKDDKKE